MKPNRLVANGKIGRRPMVVTVDAIRIGTAGGTDATWSVTGRVDTKAIVSPLNRSRRVTEERKRSRKSSHRRKIWRGKYLPRYNSCTTI